MSEISQTGKLFVVSAPSGAGKTSLIRALLENTDTFGVAVSHTTREKRAEEKDTVNYFFTDTESFNAMVERDEFLEWAHIFGNQYGTSIAAANSVLAASQDLLLEIDWQGAQQVREKLPSNLSIFVFPPSLAALRQRLEARAQDDEESVETRTAAAIEEISHWAEFDYLIVNDDFDLALQELQLIVQGKGEHFRREQRESDLQQLIADLLPQNLP